MCCRPPVDSIARTPSSFRTGPRTRHKHAGGHFTPHHRHIMRWWGRRRHDHSISAADVDGKKGEGGWGGWWFLAVASERSAMYLRTARPTESSPGRVHSRTRDPQKVCFADRWAHSSLASSRCNREPGAHKRFARQSLTTLPGVHRGGK